MLLDFFFSVSFFLFSPLLRVTRVDRFPRVKSKTHIGCHHVVSDEIFTWVTREQMRDVSDSSPLLALVSLARAKIDPPRNLGQVSGNGMEEKCETRCASDMYYRGYALWVGVLPLHTWCPACRPAFLDYLRGGWDLTPVTFCRTRGGSGSSIRGSLHYSTLGRPVPPKCRGSSSANYLIHTFREEHLSAVYDSGISFYRWPVFKREDNHLAREREYFSSSLANIWIFMRANIGSG